MQRKYVAIVTSYYALTFHLQAAEIFVGHPIKYIQYVTYYFTYSKKYAYCFILFLKNLQFMT